MKHIILIITAITLLGSSLTAQETAAADLMAKGLYEENINGDYNKAGEYYQKILDEFGGEKKMAAQAMYHLGLCAEKYRQGNAQQYFVDVIEKFPDEIELISKARAKLSDSEGIKYFTDSRDGRAYKYVGIGKQYWMAENMSYLPEVSPLNKQEGIWVYDYDGKNVEEARLTDNYKTYGCLYDWETAMKICPDNWHLPTHQEWIQLENFIGLNDPETNEEHFIYGDPVFFNRLVDNNDWRKPYQENITQFSALPGGNRVSRGSRNFFYGKGGDAHFWTATQNDPDHSWSLWLFKMDSKVFPRIAINNNDGYSVRCVCDTIRSSNKINSPTISFTYPSTSGSSFVGFVPLVISVKELIPIEEARFYLIDSHDTLLLGKDYGKEGSPWRGYNYSCGWNTTLFDDGQYTIYIELIDFWGKKYKHQDEFTVFNNPPDKFDGKFVDPRDNQEYKYVKIGDQTWMAENLNYNLNEGSGSWCLNNLSINCDTYGRLYNQETALEACPTGWHLSSDEEWLELERFLGMKDEDLQEDYSTRESGNVGLKLKSVTGWSKPPRNRTYVDEEGVSHEQEGSGLNSVGFNALPGGWISSDYFEYLGFYTVFWTSTQFGRDQVWIRDLSNSSNGVSRYTGSSEFAGGYVRCIKD